MGVKLGECGEVGDPGGVVAQLDIVLGWLDSCGCLSGRVLIAYYKRGDRVQAGIIYLRRQIALAGIISLKVLVISNGIILR